MNLKVLSQYFKARAHIMWDVSMGHACFHYIHLSLKKLLSLGLGDRKRKHDISEQNICKCNG